MVAAALYLAYPLFQHSTKHFTCIILINPHSPCGVVVVLASPSYRGGGRGTESFYPKIPVPGLFRH